MQVSKFSRTLSSFTSIFRSTTHNSSNTNLQQHLIHSYSKNNAANQSSPSSSLQRSISSNTKRNMVTFNDGSKPSIPAEYVRPKVWSVSGENGGTFSAVNRPTAGARSEKDLHVGKHPIQLYSLGTPNGQKATIMMEELIDAGVTDFEYDAWRIGIMDQDQFTSGFVNINPNSKIPAMVDTSVEDGEPIRVFESGSILFYLAEKYGKFLPKDIRQRTEVMNWLMFQMGTGPYIGGGFGHFYAYAPVHIEYAIDRFSMEVKREMDVLDKHLGEEGEKMYMVGDELTIADIALYPWVRALMGKGYSGADEFLQMNEYKNLSRWFEHLSSRKAFQRGVRVNGFTEDAIKERHSKDDFKPEDY